jgi:hypothetical protein
MRIPYRQIHIFLNEDGRMQSVYSLYVLVDKYASEIEKLNLDGDQLEEYSTILLRLQNAVETGAPNERIVDECLHSLSEWNRRTAVA